MKNTLFPVLLALLVALGLGACQSTAPADDDPWLIIPGQQFGKITKPEDATMAGIEKLYGGDAVRQTVYIGEGVETEGIVLFAGKPNEVEVAFDPESGSDRAMFFRVGVPGSDWHTEQGVRIGTTLEELQAINGKPFTFYGFGWDFGGWVSDWRDGQINPELRLSLDLKEDEIGDDLLPVLGDTDVNSDTPVLEGKKVEVTAIMFLFAGALQEG